MATMYISVPPKISAEAGKAFSIPVTVNMYGVGHAVSFKFAVEFNGRTYEATGTMYSDGSQTFNINIDSAPCQSGSYSGKVRASYYVSAGQWTEFGSAPFTVEVTGSCEPKPPAPQKTIFDYLDITVSPNPVPAGGQYTVTIKPKSGLFNYWLAAISSTPGYLMFEVNGKQTSTYYVGQGFTAKVTLTAPSSPGTYSVPIKVYGKW